MLKESLLDESKWNEFLNYKLSKDFIPKKEKDLYSDYILNKKYIAICTSILENNYTFSVPKKHLISKGHSAKKRVVYTFNNNEMIILKFISYLMYEYDYLFSPNLYSFRKSSGVKEAVRNVSNIKTMINMYGYKVDIHNYFNSIDTTIILENLKNDIKDELLYSVLYELLISDDVEYNGKIIKEQKGVMAGTPISAFLANYYIKEIDAYFWKEKVVYLRYADDMILFCNRKEDLDHFVEKLHSFFEKYKLEINKDKEYYFEPNTKWEFLGFSFSGRNIDISENSVYKIKGKIRRSARGIRRWMIKNNADYIVALKAMNRKFNRKFFGKQESEEFSWKHWFFPTINTINSLKIIDGYMQEQLRYIATGRHNKMNYKKVPYSTLKECNYKSLVNEYYKFNEQKDE